MTKRSYTLFTLFDFSVKIDPSWLVLGALVTWSLAMGYFPYTMAGLPTATCWALGVLGAVVIFLSIVFHELCHSLVARRFGMEMRGITLFIFGGVAEMGEEPPTPRAEFYMAAAGPVSSLVLAFVLNTFAGYSPPVPSMFLHTMAVLNFVLALFNLIPAFPLDGGRILRSALWAYRGNLTSATRITAGLGVAFGAILIALGILGLFMGDMLGGVWRILIGLFLQSAARRSQALVLMQDVLQGKRVEDLMRADTISVPPTLTLSDLVQQHFVRHPLQWLPVTGVDGTLFGCVDVAAVREVPRHAWPFRTVGDVARPCDTDHLTIHASLDAMQAVQRMSRAGADVLLVVDGDRVRGLLLLADVLRYVDLHARLGTQAPADGGNALSELMPGSGVLDVPPMQKQHAQPLDRFSAFPHTHFKPHGDNPNK